MPVRRYNQLSFEATDFGGWSFVGSNLPVMNESMKEMIYEMNHNIICMYWTADVKSSEAMILVVIFRFLYAIILLELHS